MFSFTLNYPFDLICNLYVCKSYAMVVWILYFSFHAHIHPRTHGVRCVYIQFINNKMNDGGAEGSLIFSFDPSIKCHQHNRVEQSNCQLCGDINTRILMPRIYSALYTRQCSLSVRLLLFSHKRSINKGYLLLRRLTFCTHTMRLYTIGLGTIAVVIVVVLANGISVVYVCNHLCAWGVEFLFYIILTI